MVDVARTILQGGANGSTSFMSEPRNAYIATTITPAEVKESGGLGSSGRNHATYTTMYLDPTQAVRDAFKWMGKFEGDDTKVHVYQVDLSELEGVWPRVSSMRYNDFQLQWSSTYFGKIPAPVLKWINSMTRKRFDLLNSAP